MSTRCCVHFCREHKGEPKTYAAIYLHSDGYPEVVLPDLERFFAEVEKQTKDARFNDPEYLAARYVVWQAGEYVRLHMEYGGAVGGSLDFLGLGVCLPEYSDTDYEYKVLCYDSNPPKVLWS